MYEREREMNAPPLLHGLIPSWVLRSYRYLVSFSFFGVCVFYFLSYSGSWRYNRCWKHQTGVNVCCRESRDNCAFGENEKRHEDLNNKLPHMEAKGVKSLRKLRKKAENLKSRVPIGDKPKSNEIAKKNKGDIILSFK